MESPCFSRPQSTASHLFARTRSFHRPTYKRPGSCHVGVSKRFSRSISLAVYTLSVHVMLVSRNVFHVVSVCSLYCFYIFLLWLIRSLVDPTLAAFIVCGPLQFVTHL